MQKEALAAKRGREPHDSSREPNCPPPQVALARSSKAHLGPTSHHCRCEQLSGMQSYGNRRTKPESKCLGEQNTPPHRSRRQALSPKLTRWFLHRCPPKRGNELQKRQLLLQIISSPTRRSRRFFLRLGRIEFPTGCHDFKTLARYNRKLWMRRVEKGGVLGFEFGCLTTQFPRSTPPCESVTIRRWLCQPRLPRTC